MAKARPFAHGTNISADQSRSEVQKLVKRLGAERFLYGYENGREVIGFDVEGRRIRFELPIPPDADEQEIRRRWRGLVHRIKSKVISVEEGIAEFEEEFLNEIVLANGQSVGEWVRPQIKSIYEMRQMPALLPGMPTDD